VAGHDLPDDIPKTQQYVHRVLDRFGKMGDINVFARTGGLSTIPSSLLKECAGFLRKVCECYGQQCWYVSVEDAARTSPRMARLIGEAQCAPREMWKAMQRSTPDLILGRMEVKMLLEPEAKASRQEATTQGLQLTEEDLMRMVFIDEKTIYAHPCTSVNVICPVGTELQIAEE
jgi:hypothetical protein